jgi:UDP-glucose 4-epimerase
MYLSQAIRLAGKPSVPVPCRFVNATAGLVRRTGKIDFSPDQLQFLLFGRVGDITRMRQEFDYDPAYSTREAFADFIGSRRIAALVDSDTVMRWERELYEFLTRRSHASTSQGGSR